MQAGTLANQFPSATDHAGNITDFIKNRTSRSLFFSHYSEETYSYSRSDKNLKICQVIDSDKCNLLTKVDFVLKSGFQVTAFFISLEVGCLIIIVVNIVYK